MTEGQYMLICDVIRDLESFFLFKPSEDVLNLSIKSLRRVIDIEKENKVKGKVGGQEGQKEAGR